MNKTALSIVFSIMVVFLTVAPSILSIVDDSYDISILISPNEEEEKKGEEKVKALKIKAPSTDNVEYAIDYSLANLLNTHSENYNSLFKELTSPPPERI